MAALRSSRSIENQSILISRMMSMVERPSQRPLSSATTIDFASDNEENVRKSGWQSRKQSMLARTIEDEQEEVSDAESFESLTSRAKLMSDLLSDSDSSIDGRRQSFDENRSMTTISSEGPGTPRSPAPEYREDDFQIEFSDEKSYRSISMVETPCFAERVKEMTTVGPTGPHLFRSSSYSSSRPTSIPPISIPVPKGAYPPSPVASSPRSSRSRRSQHMLFTAQPTPPSDSEPEVIARPRSRAAIYSPEEVRAWTTSQVCQWMVSCGFDSELVSAFRMNDITGALLFDLKWNDLKELDINSFGKRIELWTEIASLRTSDVPTPGTPDAEFVRPSSRIARTNSNTSSRRSPVSARGRSDEAAIIRNRSVRDEIISEADEDTDMGSRERAPRARPQLRRKAKKTNVRIPRRQISVDSIVITSEGEDLPATFGQAEEHFFVCPPRRTRTKREGSTEPARKHRCKKHHRKHDSEDSHTCSKGDRCAKHGARARRARSVSRSGSPEHGTILIATTPSIADDMPRPMSMGSAGSILASSDVLGPVQRSEIKLQESALRDIQRMDPQENVRKFLSCQEVEYLQEVRDEPPPVPTKSAELLARAVSPAPQRSQTAPPPRSVSPPQMIQRSNTPAFGARGQSLQGMERAQPPQMHFSTPSRMRTPTLLRTTTPFSEADVPIVTSSPVYVREQSSSVPPDLHYRNRYPTPTIESLTSPTPPPVRRTRPALNVVDENAEWEAVDEEVKMAPSPTTRTHSGWMKKRRTHWFRHEWPDYHFVLQGTHLGFSKDVATGEVGHIDMDDYQVACSASNSHKLAAAFKKAIIGGKKKDEALANSYFFQLVPATDNNGRPKRNIGKAHYFSVGTREERIDWMRELMLAKAIKQKKQGFEVEVNGERV